MRPEPGKIPVPSPSPTSPLLQFDLDQKSQEASGKDAGHFFNPNSRMKGLKSGTISTRFDSTGVTNEGLERKKESMKSRKMKNRGSARRSTRVRVSSFFSIFNPRRSRAPNSAFDSIAINKPLNNRPKRSFFQKIFGFMKKSPKNTYDIVDYEPDTGEQLAEGLDIDFDAPVDPRQHFRNTPNIFGSVTSVEGKDIMKENNREPTKVKDDVESVDLFEVDKMRQSQSQFSWTSPEDERDPAFSFAGKTSNLLQFPTKPEPAVEGQSLHEIELNKSKKRKGSLFLLEMDSPREPIPTAKTLTGEDLPKFPIKVKSTRDFPDSDKVLSSRDLPEPKILSSRDLPEPKILSSRDFADSDALESREYIQTDPLRSTDFKSHAALQTADFKDAAALRSIDFKDPASLRSIDFKDPNESTTTKNKLLGSSKAPAEISEHGEERSGVWSVDNNIASVLASAATLKRKKKSSVLRSSTKRDNSIHTFKDNVATVIEKENRKSLVPKKDL